MTARRRAPLKPNIQAALSYFARENGLAPDQPETAERFVTHLVLHDLGFSDFDIDQIVSGGANDNQIDALAISINDDFVSTPDEIETIITSRPENALIRVEFVVLQITMADRWEQGKLYSFAGGVSNFFDDEMLAPENARLAELRACKDYLFDLLKTADGPKDVRLKMFLACASENAPDQNISGAQENARRMVERLGLFREVSLGLIDGNRLDELNGQWRRANEGLLRMGGMTPLPPSPSVGRGWIGWARARDLLKIITMERGGVRPNVFFENVRGYLGADEKTSPANVDMARALRAPDKAEFVFRNNGVAIIARSAEQIGDKELRLTGYQIVNGCQTSYTLYEERAHLTDSVAVPVKVVETSELSAIRSITAATNNQTPVGDSDFLSQLPFVRKLQNYFSGKRLRDDTAPLWLERRANELAARRVETPHQIVSLVDVLETYLAAFEERAHLVHDQGWKAALPRIDRGEVLTPGDNAEIYYACAILRWRVSAFEAQYMERRKRENAALSAGRRRRSYVYPARHQLALALKIVAAPDLPMIGRPSFRGGAFDAALSGLVALLRDDAKAARLIEDADILVRGAIGAISDSAPFSVESARKKLVTDHLIDQRNRS